MQEDLRFYSGVKTNWHKYNLAKTKEKRIFYELLYELSKLIPETLHDKGRKPTPLSDLIFCLGLKLYSNYSGRKVSSDIELSQRAGYIKTTPHFNTLNDFLRCSATYDLLQKLLTLSAMPLKELEDHYSMDASGFGAYEDERWRRVRYSEGYGKAAKTFLKGHICIGTRTNVICSCEITNAFVADVSTAPILLERLNANFNPKEVSADRGYSAKRIHQIIQAMNATPFILFKSITNPKKGDPQIWKEMHLYFSTKKEWYLNHYHKRSNVETTFSMIKLKLGEFLRCKNFESQRNELMMKFICHNICCLISEIFESDVHIDFRKCLDEYIVPKPIEVPEEVGVKVHGNTGRLKFKN